MKLGYGYRRFEADLVSAGAENIFIDLSRERPMRDDMLLALRPGDEVIVLYDRDLGGSPVADDVWRAKVEAAGAVLVEKRPEKPVKIIGRPKKPVIPDDKLEAVRAIWLGGGSELTRLRHVAEAVGVQVGKGLLVGRFGSPSNPKEKQNDLS